MFDRRDVLNGMAISLWKVATDIRLGMGDSPKVVYSTVIAKEQAVAMKAAEDLAKLYEHVNGRTLDEMFERGGYDEDKRNRYQFGWSLAEGAINRETQRHGWPALSMQKGITIPSFMIMFTGTGKKTELVWDGDDKPGVQRNPWIVVAGGTMDRPAYLKEGTKLGRTFDRDKAQQFFVYEQAEQTARQFGQGAVIPTRNPRDLTREEIEEGVEVHEQWMPYSQGSKWSGRTRAETPAEVAAYRKIGHQAGGLLKKPRHVIRRK